MLHPHYNVSRAKCVHRNCCGHWHGQTCHCLGDVQLTRALPNGLILGQIKNTARLLILISESCCHLYNVCATSPCLNENSTSSLLSLGFSEHATICFDLRRSKKVSEVYRVLAVEGSEARREQEKGGMSRGVTKSVELACVKTWSCVCPSRSYEMFPAICEIAASQDETPL